MHVTRAHFWVSSQHCGRVLAMYTDLTRCCVSVDLEHNECNRLLIPWVNLGFRDNHTLRERVGT